MSEVLSLYWFLPLEPDVSYIGTWQLEGPEPTLDYMVAITNAAESAGFQGLLVHTGYTVYHETWLATAAVLARTAQAQLIVAVRPNQYHPAQAAKMAATLQNLFPGRLALNVVAGSSDEDSCIGNFDDRETRYRRAAEWLEVVKSIWYSPEPVNYEGQIYRVADSWLNPELSAPVPIFLSGSTAAAHQLAIAHADTYLLWGAPVADVAQEIAQMRALAGANHPLRFGLRIHVIVRPSEAEAWEAADQLISRVDPELRALLTTQQHESPSRAAQQQLTRNELIVGPNLWAGVGLGRKGVTTALVGNPEQIVERLLEYQRIGISTFILSGYPKLAEAQRFGTLVMPLLREAGVVA